MKKKLVKILTVAFCIVTLFTINSFAWTEEQPPQDYLPLIMRDTQTVMWQMLPYDTFAIDINTFPEGESFDDIGNVVIVECNTMYGIWTETPLTGGAEGAVQFYGVYYTSAEPTGFQVRVYDYYIENEYIIVNLGIYEPATSEWVYDPEQYNHNYAMTNPSKAPIAFFSNDTDNASGQFNRTLSYWILSHYPIANTYWEEQDNPLYNIGYRDGKTNAEKNMYDEGKVAGYNEAALTEFNRGYNAGLQDSDTATFSSLIFAVIDTPISILTNILDFDILGTNMASFVKQMISALFFLIIVKVIIKVLV